MIDTVKFQIKVDADTFSQIRSKSEEFIHKDNVKNQQDMRYMKVEVPIGSYDHKITIKAYDEVNYMISFECSLPKQYLGENIHLLYTDQIVKACESIMTSFTTIFPKFPHYEQWIVQRLDICYAWKYISQHRAEGILEVLKQLKFPRKTKHSYKESIMFRGRHYTCKFYLKQPEVRRHDYSRLVKENKHEFADSLLALSEGVLRFEVTIRKQQLIKWFEKKCVYVKDISDYKLIESLLKYSLNKVLQNRTPKSMSDDEILNKLSSTYTNEKAMRLYTFHNAYYSSEPNVKENLIAKYHHSTIWRNLRDIANAKVGLSNKIVDFVFDLSIPSDYVINKASITPGLGGVSNTA